MVTWAHAQGVDLPALSNVGMLERLNDPIDTSTESHVDRHKETHKARGERLRMGRADPRDTTVDGCIGSFWCTRSTKGNDSSFGHDGLRSGVTHTKDTKIHDDDIWIPYKSTRVHNQGRIREQV
jgi:hypothetical protein